MKNPFSSQSVLKTRLLSAISDLDFQLKALKNKPESHTFIWLPLAESALEEAVKNTNCGENDRAWNSIHIVERFLTLSMNADALKDKAIVLRNETEKIGTPRKNAMIAILKDIENENDVEKIRLKVVRAMHVREDYYNTKYHKLALRRVSMNLLCLMMSIFVIAIVVFSKFYNLAAPSTPVSADAIPSMTFRAEALLGTLLGALGASFSMSYTLTNESLETKIPDQLLGMFVTIMRLAIGATAAFIALLLFHSNLFDSLLNEKLLKSPFAFSVIAFIAGFSERFILTMISVVSNDKVKADKS